MSTTKVAPAACAIFATAAMSMTSSTGLVGLSRKNVLVFGANRFSPLVEIGAVDEGRGDAEARQEILDHPAARAEQRLRGDDVIAGLELPDQRSRHRRHAGRGRARRFGPLEGRHPALEHRDRRIGETRIEEAGLFALEARLALLGTVVDKALGEKQGFRGFAELRAHAAGVDEFGFGTIAARGRGHGDLQQKSRPECFRAGFLQVPRPFSDLFNVAASRPAQIDHGTTRS